MCHAQRTLHFDERLLHADRLRLIDRRMITTTITTTTNPITVAADLVAALPRKGVAAPITETEPRTRMGRAFVFQTSCSETLLWADILLYEGR